MPTADNVSQTVHPKHRRVSDFLRSEIRYGNVRVGDKLPSYEQLSTQFETTKIAVNRALAELEADGLVDIRPRSGVYVADKKTNGASQGSIAITVDGVLSYWSLMVKGAHDALLDHNVDIVLINSLKDTDLTKFTGVIYHTKVPDSHPANVPCVVIGSTGSTFPSIAPDDFAGGQLAAQHLVTLGHKRIAYLGHPTDRTVATRVAGYRFALGLAGICWQDNWFRSIGDNYVCSAESGSGAYAEMKYWLTDGDFLASGFTAILAQNDIHAAYIYRALAESGLNVPSDVSVIGFDDLPECRVMHPALTTVHSPIDVMGRMAVESLLRQSKASDCPLPTSTLLHAELIVRESTAPPKG